MIEEESMTRLAILSMAALSLFWAMPDSAVVHFDHGFDTPADDTNTADHVPNAGDSIYRGPVATAPYSFSGPSESPSNANSNTTLGGRSSIIFAPAANTGFSDNWV